MLTNTKKKLKKCIQHTVTHWYNTFTPRSNTDRNCGQTEGIEGSKFQFLITNIKNENSVRRLQIGTLVA